MKSVQVFEGDGIEYHEDARPLLWRTLFVECTEVCRVAPNVLPPDQLVYEIRGFNQDRMHFDSAIGRPCKIHFNAATETGTIEGILLNVSVVGSSMFLTFRKPL